MAAPAIYADKATQTAPYDATKYNSQDANQVKAYLAYLESDKQATLVSATNIKTVNGTSVLGSGNITITGRPYKVYSALLSFDSGGITINQLENTIGDGSGDGVNDIQWSNPLNGAFYGTMTDSPFITNKTFCLFSGDTGYTHQFKRFSNNIVFFDLQFHDGTQTGTPFFNSASIEVRVYD